MGAKKKVPTCGRCGKEHYNFKGCPGAEAKAPRAEPVLERQQAPVGGFTVSDGWGGRNTRGVPVTFQMPAIRRSGSLVGPDGTEYIPLVVDRD